MSMINVDTLAKKLKENIRRRKKSRVTQQKEIVHSTLVEGGTSDKGTESSTNKDGSIKEKDTKSAVSHPAE